MENGRKWKMVENGKGKSWKRKKLEKEKAGKGKSWKRKNKCLTMRPENDRILTTGKTRPAMKAGKKNGGIKMETTKTYIETLREWEAQARERATVGISEKLVAAGIIKAGQKEVGPEKIRDAFAAACMPELLRQEEKASTGGGGKFADIGNRCLMREARGLSMPIYDLRCRGVSQPDITVFLDGNDEKTVEFFGRTRSTAELKTGAGCLAGAGELAASWYALIRAIETGKLIIWYPYGINGWQDGNIDTIDDMPYFFGTYRKLFNLLSEYNGGIGTWLKECGENVNFQNIRTSGKKMAYLETVCEQGFDWPMFRDWGRIRTK